MNHRVGVLLVGILVCSTPLSVEAATPSPTYHYQRLFYYTQGKVSKADFFAHANLVDVFAPQTYALLADGTLSGSVDADLVAFAKTRNIKIMPLVTNDGFGETAYKTILSDPVKAESAISTLVRTARNQGYAGWEFDFEQMSADYRDEYSAFIARAADAFHGAGLTLSVAVIAKISDNPNDYPEGSWQKHIGVYDYDALGKATDFISVMSYDEPYNSGPAAPMPWLKKVLAYSLLHIPADKISLGIPLYYWLRRDDTNKLIETGGNAGIQHAFKAHYYTMHWSGHSEVPYLEWKRGGLHFTLWYENGRSIAAKLALVKTNKLYGVSLWSLGLGVPSVYEMLKE